MFSKEQLKQFRTDFKNTNIALEQKYNIKMELGNIGYSDIAFHAKLTCTKVNTGGKKIVDTSNFNFLKQVYGYKGNLGDSYNENGVTYTVINLDSKKRKNNVILSASNGKEYKADPSYVNRLLGLG